MNLSAEPATLFVATVFEYVSNAPLAASPQELSILASFSVTFNTFPTALTIANLSPFVAFLRFLTNDIDSEI